MAGPMSFEYGAVLLDTEVVETLRTRPRVSLTRNAEGALVVQDEMGRLLMSLRQHSANGQRVTLLLVDDRSGHGIARTLVRYAVQRSIKVSPEFVRFVFVSMRPGKPIFGPFRRAPWPGGKPVAIAPSTPAAPPITAAAAIGRTTELPATKSVPAFNAGISTLPDRPAPTARQPDFRLVRDKRFANGTREVIIQHLPTGITAQSSTGGGNTTVYMEFAFFDPDDESLFFETVICQDNIDLTDPVEFEELCEELRQVIPDADRDD
jgi:hypothetical protein